MNAFDEKLESIKQSIDKLESTLEHNYSSVEKVEYLEKRVGNLEKVTWTIVSFLLLTVFGLIIKFVFTGSW